jgi:hypothetical protein
MDFVWVNPRSLIESYGLGRGSKTESEGGWLHEKTVTKYERAMRKDRIAAFYDLGFPLNVWKELDGLVIGDGHHRVYAAIRAGLRKIPVRVLEREW